MEHELKKACEFFDYIRGRSSEEQLAENSYEMIESFKTLFNHKETTRLLFKETMVGIVTTSEMLWEISRRGEDD
jgi:hypothetical protein